MKNKPAPHPYGKKPKERKVPYENKGIIAKIEAIKPDPDLTAKLFSIYFTHVLRGNRTAAARQLGIARQTVNTYAQTPPTQAWWPIVLRLLIEENIKWYSRHTKKKYRDQADIIRAHMAALKMPQLRSNAMLYKLDDDPDEHGALNHLLTLLVKYKGKIPVHKLSRPSVSGGYSLRTLRYAKDQIGLIITRKDDKTYWEIHKQKTGSNIFTVDSLGDL